LAMFVGTLLKPQQKPERRVRNQVKLKVI